MFEECLKSTRRAFRLDVIPFCLEALADIAHGMSSIAETFAWAMVYFAFVCNGTDLGRKLHALRCLGDIFRAQGDNETALNVFCAALEGATEMDIHRLKAECLVGMAEILMLRGDRETAQANFKAARLLFDRSGLMKNVGEVDRRMSELQKITDTLEARVRQTSGGFQVEPAAPLIAQ
jgi:tetratricopeptide (TPR) repeat protein